MPRHDYTHDVEQIRNALHDGRASVMVGAGFSFNAQRCYSLARSFPSWPGLAQSLVERLYPDDEEARSRALKSTGFVALVTDGFRVFRVSIPEVVGQWFGPRCVAPYGPVSDRVNRHVQ
jgi:hypothetical protein